VEGTYNLLRDVGIVLSGVWTVGIGACKTCEMLWIIVDWCRRLCSGITLRLSIQILRVSSSLLVLLSWCLDSVTLSGKFLELDGGLD
jgi:hypothetical protein